MCRVSVVMPLYNAQDYVAEAIESILNQTFADFELLIIDNCSEDASVSMVQKFHDPRIRLIQNEQNYGLAFSRNKGISLSKGEFIAPMDADDIAAPQRLEKEVRFLDQHPKTAAIGGKHIEIDKNGKPLANIYPQSVNPAYIKAYLILSNMISNGTTLYRRNIVQKYQIHYQENYYGLEDYRFWCDLSRKGSIENLNEIFQYYRVLPSSLTRASKQQQRDRVLDEIHELNFKNYGFQFPSSQHEILLKMFREEGAPASAEEIQLLYQALSAMSSQAKNAEMENAKEINIMCRKRFGEKVAKAFFLWPSI